MIDYLHVFILYSNWAALVYDSATVNSTFDDVIKDIKCTSATRFPKDILHREFGTLENMRESVIYMYICTSTNNPLTQPYPCPTYFPNGTSFHYTDVSCRGLEVSGNTCLTHGSWSV